jgi:catechol 2,3-dioxygenase
VPIPPETTVGPVNLTVADLDRTRDFYERAIGLRALKASGEVVRLGADGVPAVELSGRPQAPARPPGTTGLFHLAICVPSRADLALTMRRVTEAGWRFTGASDHLVSEALYLRDPEGNGIEIYRDRLREEWPRVDGEIQMDTHPLDVESLLAEVAGVDADPDWMPRGTRIGHVHLQVADLADAEAFYGGLLGFEVTVRGYPGALFLSAGGYHHHIGLNTWAGEGAPAPAPGSRGLRWFEVVLPGPEEPAGVAERLESAGVGVERREDGLHVADPSGNHIVLEAASR